MKLGVLWIYQTVKLPGGGKIEAGQKPCLCFKGRKHMLCVAAGHPVRVLVRPAEDFEQMRRVPDGDGYYSVADAIERFRGIAKRCGITRGAWQLLGRAAELTRCPESAGSDMIPDEEAFCNEEGLLIEPTTTTTEGETAMTTEQPAEAGNGASPTPMPDKRAPKSRRPPKDAAPKAAKAAKPAKTAKAKKPAKPAAAKRVAGKSEPREGTVGALIYARLQKGQDSAAISEAAVKAGFKKVTVGYVGWWRNALTKRGLLKAAKD